MEKEGGVGRSIAPMKNKTSSKGPGQKSLTMRMGIRGPIRERFVGRKEDSLGKMKCKRRVGR